MLTKPASMALMVTTGAVITGAVVFSVAQLAEAGSTSAGSASSAAKTTPSAVKTTPPGQAKKSESPTPQAEPPSKSLTVSPISVTGLAPGLSVSKTLVVGNPNNQDVTLQSLGITASSVTPSPSASRPCSSPADFEVLLTGPASGDIAKNSSKSVPVVIRLNNSPTRNQDGCKSKTFHFTFTATATSK